MTAAGDGKDDGHGDDGARRIVPFPFSRVAPTQTGAASDTPCMGEIATALGISIEQSTGHWCSRCNKLWYGYLLEVACPTCGNRHG